MTRDEYTDRMIRASMRLGRYFRFYDAKFLPDELVEYDGMVYYPEKIIFGADRHGMSVITCRLHSLSANSTVEAELSKVKEYKHEDQSNN